MDQQQTEHTHSSQSSFHPWSGPKGVGGGVGAAWLQEQVGERAEDWGPFQSGWTTVSFQAVPQFSATPGGQHAHTHASKGFPWSGSHQVSLAFCRIPAHHLQWGSVRPSLCQPTAYSKTAIKTERWTLSFIFPISFQKKKKEKKKKHTLTTSQVPSHPIFTVWLWGV